jgi:hypothetical protein
MELVELRPHAALFISYNLKQGGKDENQTKGFSEA